MAPRYGSSRLPPSRWNYDARYLRDILEASPRAARLFWRVSSLGQYRRDIPIEAWSAAGITAVRHEDCGPCTQLAVTTAERAGVSPEVLRAVLKEDPERMPADVALVWRFTRASLARDVAADDYRDAIVNRWGPRALVSLAFAMAAGPRLPDRQVRPGARQGLHTRHGGRRVDGA